MNWECHYFPLGGCGAMFNDSCLRSYLKVQIQNPDVNGRERHMVSDVQLAWLVKVFLYLYVTLLAGLSVGHFSQVYLQSCVYVYFLTCFEDFVILC